MPTYALMCFDKPGSLALRMATREAHLAYVAEQKATRYGGPLLDAAEQMSGSLIILEVADRAAAQAFSDNDPYRKAGLFERIEIRGFRPILGNP